MLSLIVCARKNDISEILKHNIAQTIGVEYELIVINNEDNQYNIFQAYNKGVTLSRFPYLVFMHDDILYHTQGWGNNVLTHFQIEKTGAIGIAGTAYMPFTPGAWWHASLLYLHLLQSEKNSEPAVMLEHNSFSSAIRDAVALDGVWFCIKKSLFDKVRFDDVHFHGFHFYDVDITLQVYKQGYNIFCITDVLLQHASPGPLNKTWAEQLLVFQQKWKKELPITCKQISFAQQCHAEYKVNNTFVSDQLRIYGANKKERKRIYLFSLKSILNFRKGYLYFRTPFWLAKSFLRYLRSLF